MARAPSRRQLEELSKLQRIEDLEAALAPFAVLAAQLPDTIGDGTIIGFVGPGLRLQVKAGQIRAAARVAGEGEA